METLLNFAWLVLALAIVAGWVMQKEGADRPSIPWQVTALVCLLVFLFFPISISDDLHWTPLALDVSDASRKMLGPTFLRASAAANHVYVVAVVLAQLLLSARAASAVVELVSPLALPAQGFAAPRSPRAPPLS